MSFKSLSRTSLGSSSRCYSTLRSCSWQPRPCCRPPARYLQPRVPSTSGGSSRRVILSAGPPHHHPSDDNDELDEFDVWLDNEALASLPEARSYVVAMITTGIFKVLAGSALVSWASGGFGQPTHFPTGDAGTVLLSVALYLILAGLIVDPLGALWYFRWRLQRAEARHDKDVVQYVLKLKGPLQGSKK